MECLHKPILLNNYERLVECHKTDAQEIRKFVNQPICRLILHLIQCRCNPECYFSFQLLHIYDIYLTTQRSQSHNLNSKGNSNTRITVKPRISERDHIRYQGRWTMNEISDSLISHPISSNAGDLVTVKVCLKIIIYYLILPIYAHHTTVILGASQ